MLDEAKAKPEPGNREVVNGFSGSSVISGFLDGKSAMALEKPGPGCTLSQSGDERRGFLCTGELGGVCSGIH